MTISKKIKKIVFFLLMVGWICFIFSLSLQPAVQSSAVSSGLLKSILETFYNITKIKIEFAAVHNLFRTFAHFTEFFLLGIFSLLYFFTAMNKKPIYAVITGLCVSICDELIQFYFAEGRAMQFKDIAVDSLGILISSIVFYLIYKTVLYKKSLKAV